MRRGKWEPGALARVVIAEQPENQDAIVVLLHKVENITSRIYSGASFWKVSRKDGQKLFGRNSWTNARESAAQVCFAQPTLRLLDDDDDLGEIRRKDEELHA